MQVEKSKILVIRLGAIGDVVHTTNVYRAIKALYPDVEVHYMTTKTQACFLENDKDVDKVIIVQKSDLSFFKVNTLAQKLKRENYDCVLNLQPNFKTRLLCFLSGIKKRLIYKKSFKLHAVENFFRVAKKYFDDIKLPPKMTLYLSEEVKQFAENEVRSFKKPIIAFNAGGIISPRQGRTYPVEKWFNLGKLLQEKYNGTIVLTGTMDDYEFLKPLEAIPGVVSYIGKTTLEQNAGIISQCDLMVSGDSGPLHIATALDVPSIGLYGSMPINRTGTYGDNCISLKSEMSCVPCNRRKCKYLKKTKKIYAPCMEKIVEENIVKEVEKLLGKI